MSKSDRMYRAGRVTGKTAHRRRCVARCISWLLIALMTVGPERVYALSVEAQAHAAYAKAVAAGVLAQAVPGKFDWSYDYDDNGNLESTTKSNSNGTVVQADGYSYDGENRLATHTLGGALDVTYAYDADGIRTWSKKAGADPTYFLTDKNRPYAQVIEERTWLDPADPDNPDPEDALLAVRYTYGDDLIAQDRVVDPAADPLATTRSYYHYDGQLSTRILTDAQAAPDTPSTAPPTVTDTYTYDAFGNLIDSTTDDGTPTTNNYRYTGEQYDPNLGFYYLRARYYDQAVGRFTTRDTFGGNTFEPISLHKYVYVANDPTNRIDATGHTWEAIRGTAAHYWIASRFIEERYPEIGWVRAWGWIIESLVWGGIRPDIVDHANRVFYDIKPFNPAGLAAGTAKVNLYRERTGFAPGSTWPGSVRLEPFLNGIIVYWLQAPGLITYRVIGVPREEYVYDLIRDKPAQPATEHPAWRTFRAPAARTVAAVVPVMVPILLLAVAVAVANKIQSRGAAL